MAIDPAKHLDQYGHDFWTSQNGLPGEAVYQILQSPDGYLWLRSSAGLVRFDGVRFVLVDPVVEHKPISEPVSAICLSASHDLLVRTTSHTLLYRNGVFTDYLPPAPLPDGAIRTLFESRNHEVFIGSDDFIYLLRGSVITMLKRHTGWVDSFYEDENGAVWVFGASKLFRYYHGEFSEVPGHYGISGITTLAADSKRNLWVGALNGLYRLTHNHLELQKSSISSLPKEIRAIIEDHHGSLWIATANKGVARLAGDKSDFYGQPNGLSDNRVFSLYEDREGSIWMGTAGGLDRFRDTSVTTFTMEEGLPSNLIVAVLQSRDGALCATCRGGGLAIIRNGAVRSLTQKDGLSNLYPTTMFESRDGSIWLGTGGGITRYKDGKFSVSTAQGRFLTSYISSINEDDEGLIVTTDETIAFRFINDRLTPLTFAGQTTPLSKPGNYTFVTYRGPDGTLWFGTVLGLFKFVKGEPPSDARQKEIRFPVTSIFDDRRGNLWLGGRVPGLTRFRLSDKQVTRYTKKDGLFDDYLTSILPDESGNFWISTPGGIYKTTWKELDDFADGRVSIVHSIVYGVADGMKTSEASDTTTQPGAWRTRDGKLWFATKKGLVLIDPSHLLHNDQAPPVIIEGAVIDGVAFSAQSDLQIAPGNDKIEFHYTALSLRVPSRVRFKFKLDGYDRSWVEAGTRRVAYYTNLPPGKYRFRVVACNDDGIWNLAGASVGILLRPHFYQTLWFYSFIALLILSAAVGGQRFYTRQLRLRAAELEARVVTRTEDLAEANRALVAANSAKSEFLANMSHEIRTPLNGVVGMTELALNTELNSDQREYLETVRLSADSLLTVINDILDFSKIEAGKIDLETADFDLRDCLEAALRTLAVPADEKGLELLCELAPEVPEFVRGDSTRIRQIILNLVGNSIKFTHKGEIAVRVQMDSAESQQHIFHFSVSDTGIGIPPDKQKAIFEPFSQADNSVTRKYGGTGLGLTISTRLVEMMGGKIWVESVVGRGAKFHFTLHLGAAHNKPAQFGRMPPPDCLRGMKVLIVDDNRTNRRILEGFLKSLEMDATSVEGGSEAILELLAAQNSGAPYDLVLTDMHMPNMDGFELIEYLRQRPQLSAATIMMLTSAGHSDDAARCQELKVSAYLFKPIRRSELQQALTRALGSDKSRGANLLPPHVPPGVSCEPSESLHVLVVEDNLVNQRLIARLLEKRGHRVALTGNGAEALEVLQKESFDLVFMDVQMPEMGGFEATAALREREKSTASHLPVVALTAHAMKGDQERCLAEGMDDYLAKPIRPQELDEVLNKYVLRRSETTFSR